MFCDLKQGFAVRGDDHHLVSQVGGGGADALGQQAISVSRHCNRITAKWAEQRMRRGLRMEGKARTGPNSERQKDGSAEHMLVTLRNRETAVQLLLVDWRKFYDRH